MEGVILDRLSRRTCPAALYNIRWGNIPPDIYRCRSEDATRPYKREADRRLHSRDLGGIGSRQSRTKKTLRPTMY